MFVDAEVLIDEPLTLPTQAREVFDVTGAGDTVIALLGAGVGAGLAPADAAALANLGAGIVVGKIGAATASRSELQRALHSQGSGGRGLVDVPELVALVAEAKARGERVVFTNGVFDILHRGHVTYLAQARALGASLVVAVNSDASVKRLGKGDDRPVNPLADRMAVPAALEAVSLVTWFEEDTPLAPILACRPDVLVKGADWSLDAIIGRETVERAGGRVVRVQLTSDRSTSALIRTVIERLRGEEAA